MKIVEVEWLDAWATTDGVTIRQAAGHCPVVTLTVGYLVAENEHGITVAADRYPGLDNHAKVHNFIPWGIVSGYWVFEFPKEST